MGICYDLRHAYMGDRDVKLVDNGMNDDLMRWHGIKAPKNNVNYSVNVLFPEAIFVAASVGELFYYGRRNYGEDSILAKEGLHSPGYASYLRDIANLQVLSASIWEALANVIGDEALEKLIRIKDSPYITFINYVTHYIDKCNIELLKTPVEKRKDKLRNISKRIIKKPQIYKNMEASLRYSAKIYKVSIYELEDPALEYPDEIEW